MSAKASRCFHSVFNSLATLLYRGGRGERGSFPNFDMGNNLKIGQIQDGHHQKNQSGKCHKYEGQEDKMMKLHDYINMKAMKTR